MKKMLWQSMRIFKGGFTVPMLLQVVPGSTLSGVSRWVKDLERHEILTRVGGAPGDGQHQRYRIVNKRETVVYPTVCIKCGNQLNRKCIFFDPSEKKETKKEREFPKVDGKTRVADLVGTVQNFYGLPLPQERVATTSRREVPAELKERLEKKLNGEKEIHHDAA
jgi:hypothetical protein